MGLISKHEFDTINLIRKIRNIFAHEIDIVKIEDSPKLTSLCNSLSIPKGMYVPNKLSLKEGRIVPYNPNPFNDATPKDRFITTFYYIVIYLDARYLDVIKRKCIPYTAKTQSEMLSEICKTLIGQNQEYISLLKEREKILLLQKKSLLSKNNLQEKLNSTDDKDKKPLLDEVNFELAEIEACKSNIFNDLGPNFNMSTKEIEGLIAILKEGIEDSDNQ